MPLLSVQDLHVHYRLPPASWLAKAPRLHAVNGVGFELEAGRTLGVVGESGCGKSTLARALLGLVSPTSGELYLDGTPLGPLGRKRPPGLRRRMQMVFQDPIASLDPRMTVGRLLAEPLRAFEPRLGAAERRRRVLTMMERVGLHPQQINRYPHEFSGGQCQRIGIARALMPGPDLLVCDEPVSALDVSIQAQIVNLLMELQQSLGLALVFIAHDLAVVKQISHRVLVMYLGRVMEEGPTERLFRAPAHPYTQALLAAVPLPDPRRERNKPPPPLKGEPPSPLTPPSGCPFHDRCPRARPPCDHQPPPLHHLGHGHRVHCHFPH